MAQNAVCNNDPGPQDRVECTEINTNADIDLDLENVDISTQASSTDGSGIYGWKSGGTGDINIDVQSSTFRTSGDNAYGIRGVHQATGNLNLNIRDSAISTSGQYAYGIWGGHGNGTGDLGITVRGGSVATSGGGAPGIYGVHQGDGRIDIQVEDVSVTTEGSSAAHGIESSHLGSAGDLSINVQRSTVSTSDLDSIGIHGWRISDGDIDIRVKDTSVTTEGTYSHGINSFHNSTGDVGIDVQGSTISTSGDNAWGGIRVYRGRGSAGNIVINVQDSSITTSGNVSRGIFVWHLGEGGIDIDVRGTTIETLGENAFGIYGRHDGVGDLDIDVLQGSAITTSESHGIYARHLGEGGIAVRIENGIVRATGLDAHGIRVGSLDANGVVQGSVGVDEEGYRRQTVTVGSEVHGGSGNAAGIFLTGGGRVVVGPHGRVGAASGVAIRAAGRGSDGLPGSLSVDFRLDGHSIQEALGDGRIMNDDGPTELMVNGTAVFDGMAGMAGRWAPNGAWDVTARTAEQGGIETMQAYAPRAGLYESLPGLLLRLDAGTPVRRPEASAWAQVGYGTGSGDPKHSRAGASYDFDRIEAAAGTSRNWENGFGGSLWLRQLQSEVKLDMPSGPGELELHGWGAGVSAHWRGADGLEISGEASLTDFDVDADSARHGRLARDVETELWQARLETGYRMERGNGLTLLPRVWAWHAETDIDDFTDAVGSRVAYVDESRSAAGLGLLAELAQPEYSFYGSLDVESVFAGEETVVEVSGHRLTSESKRTRVLVGMGGRWQGQRMTLQGGLRLADPGGKNQEVSASVSIGGSF